MSLVCFFARTPSRILRMVNICEVVDLFLRKPFWFFLRMLSILGSMQFHSRASLEVNEFKLHSYYYFQTNTLKKGMNPSYLPSYELNSITAALLQGWFWYEGLTYNKTKKSNFSDFFLWWFWIPNETSII